MKILDAVSDLAQALGNKGWTHDDGPVSIYISKRSWNELEREMDTLMTYGGQPLSHTPYKSPIQYNAVAGPVLIFRD